MDVKQAVSQAKNYIVELFSDEKIFNLGLEEVEFDETSTAWVVTLGFSRPWDQVRSAMLLGPETPPHRTYKTLILSDDNGIITSVKNREQ